MLFVSGSNTDGLMLPLGINLFWKVLCAGVGNKLNKPCNNIRKK